MTAVDDRPRTRVIQIVTTLARGGAQATVLASSSRPIGRADGIGPADEVDVRVLSGPDRTGEGDLWGEAAAAGVTIDVVPDLVRSVRPTSDVRALRWLAAWLRAERPDVVHTHSSKAGVVGRLAAAAAGVPCVHTIHGWGPLDVGGPGARRSVIAIERLLARRTAALVVVGQGDLERGLSIGIGRPAQYRLIRSGIELPQPGDGAGGEIRRELGLGERWVVGMVGRLAAQKDQETLIEAFALVGMTDGTLVLVGDGPRRPALQAAAARHPGLDIRLLGARPDGARVVAGFDLAVNASRWEGLPRTLVEAAAAGVPVVASDVGSTADLIRSGHSGRLVPPGDAASLAEAMVAARRERSTTARMADEARRLAQDFSADTMRRDLRRLWADVAGVGPTPRPAARQAAYR